VLGELPAGSWSSIDHHDHPSEPPSVSTDARAGAPIARLPVLDRLRPIARRARPPGCPRAIARASAPDRRTSTRSEAPNVLGELPAGSWSSGDHHEHPSEPPSVPTDTRTGALIARVPALDRPGVWGRSPTCDRTQAPAPDRRRARVRPAGVAPDRPAFGGSQRRRRGPRGVVVVRGPPRQSVGVSQRDERRAGVPGEDRRAGEGRSGARGARGGAARGARGANTTGGGHCARGVLR